MRSAFHVSGMLPRGSLSSCSEEQLQINSLQQQLLFSPAATCPPLAIEQQIPPADGGPLSVMILRCVIGRCVSIQRLRRVSCLPLPKPRSDNTSLPSNMKIHAEITGLSKEDGLLICSYTLCTGKTQYVWMDGWMLNTH